MFFTRVALLSSLLCTASFSIHAELKPVSYRTAGKPSSVALTEDGKYLLLTVNGVDERRNAGVQVFSIDTAGKLKEIRLVSLGQNGVQGIVLIPHTHWLAIGLGGAGVVFAPVEDVISGKAQFRVISQGERAGSGYMAVSPDGQYLYVANEYAKTSFGNGVGTVGVIALHPSSDGSVHPQAITQVPSVRTTPGIAISPDGSRLYSVAEVFAARFADKIPGAKNPELRHDNCRQSGDRSMPSGALYVWDTAKLNALPASPAADTMSRARMRVIHAGCSPVRAVITADGKRLYLTARGDDNVIEFDTAKLESDPEHAFLRALKTDGTAPVGLALFNHDHSLLVANSNRFDGGSGTAAVIDLASGKVTQKFKAGDFPRNITLSPDGKTLYLTEFNSNTLLVIPVE
ncbi:MAG: hypothetical protein JSS87_04350 [Acidobacteria bacterium]|nr:hypothetical protein [Acidobacteriota bacterium]